MEIKDLETLKVAADPLRQQVIELLFAAPLTVNLLAEKLGLSPSKLYYHINMLEKHELIQVVETTQKGNILEKHYMAAANDYKIAKNLINFSTPEGQENVSTVMVSIMDTTREDIIRSLQARAFNLEHGAEVNPRRTLFNRLLSRIPDEKAREFMDRFEELVKEFEDADMPADKELETYALTIAVYPSFYYEQTEVNEEEEKE